MDKIIRVLGKKGRTTIPFGIRVQVGFKHNDVISYELLEDGSVLLRNEKLCCSCDLDTDDKDDIGELFEEFEQLSPYNQHLIREFVQLLIK